MSWLLSPWLIFCGIFIGVLIGLNDPELAKKILPFGALYLKFLQMLVLPMLITAVVSGLGNLFISGISRNKIFRILSFLLIGLVIASSVGLVFGLLGKPGAGLQNEDQVTLGKIILQKEGEAFESEIDKVSKEDKGLFSFVQKMIPHNIFTALNQGDSLAILFFSILVGISMGKIKNSSAELTLRVINTLFDVFLNIIGWLMYLLPIGLLCLFAGQIAEVGLDIVWATAKLIAYIYLSGITLMIIYSVIIWWKIKHRYTYLESLSALKQPVIIALGTASSLATIPSALNALKNTLKIDKNICDLVIPLGITINPPGSVLHFAISSVFIAQIYSTELGMNAMGIILIGSILAGLASSSAPGLVALGMIGMILDPLGLPANIAVIILLAIDPIIDPIITTLNVYSNCAMTIITGSDVEESSENEFILQEEVINKS